MGKLLNVTMGALALTFCAVSANAAPVVIGTSNTQPNSIPFGSNQGSYFYQQIYSSTAFSGSIDISKLSFYNTASPGGTPRAGLFDIFLSTTTYADIAGFDTTGFGANGSPSFVPSGAVQVYSGNAAAISNGRLDFDLSASFNYDPTTMGNLVLTVREFTLVGQPGPNNLFLDSYKNTGVTNGRAYTTTGDWNQGLVTGFNVGIAAVPEASTWALMIVGFAAVGTAMRRRRVAVSFA